MPETDEKFGDRIEEIACEDRISALPEDLLVTILLSIPTKDAVATMILSKRWRFIWTMLPVLAYNVKKRSVWWFLNKSMEFHKAPVLQALSIRFGRRCPTDANVGKWVENAVNRGMMELFFELQWSADPTRLPSSLYTCKTLMQLQLSHKILVDFTSSACLPSLKRLDLYCVVYKDEASLVTFLSSCPVLEILYVVRKDDDNIANFTVKVPSLRYLIYFHRTLLPDDNDDVVDTGRSVVMDTPSLTHFIITNNSEESCAIEHMPYLECAYIDVEGFHDIGKLLKSISVVSSLGLVLTDEMAVYCSTIKFSQLIKCKIEPGDSDWMDSLCLFLGNTPKLKFLIVDYSSTHEPPDASASWTERFPYYDIECLSSSLEKFELIDYGGREEETELVEYILENSKCLKTARISLRSKLEDKETIMKTLKAMFLRFNNISLFVQTSQEIWIFLSHN